MDAFAELVPPTRVVEVGGRAIEVGVLVWRQSPPFLRVIAEPLPLLASGDYLAVATTYPDHLAEALRIATGVDRAFLEGLRGDEVLELAEAVLETNLHFFVERVMPMAAASVAKLRAATSLASSTGSSAGDIAATSFSTSRRIN